MIAHEITGGPVRYELAAAIREVNAAHNEAGAPELAGLKEAWVALDRSLSLATISGNDRAARMAVDAYRERALAAISEVRR